MRQKTFQPHFCRMIHKAFFLQIQSFLERDVWMTINMLLYKLCCIYTQKKHQLDNESVLAPWGERYEKESSI